MLTELNLRNCYVSNRNTDPFSSGVYNLYPEHETVSDNNLCMLTNLKCLKLFRNNKITDECISTLINLTKLDLQANHKIHNISHFTNLTILDLLDNFNIKPKDVYIQLPTVKEIKIISDY